MRAGRAGPDDRKADPEHRGRENGSYSCQFIHRHPPVPFPTGVNADKRQRIQSPVDEWSGVDLREEVRDPCSTSAEEAAESSYSPDIEWSQEEVGIRREKEGGGGYIAELSGLALA